MNIEQQILGQVALQLAKLAQDAREATDIAQRERIALAIEAIENTVGKSEELTLAVSNASAKTLRGI